jgi:hypothetical protein
MASAFGVSACGKKSGGGEGGGGGGEMNLALTSFPDYVDPQAWDVLSDMSGRFTLAPGDILVRSITTDQIGDSLRASTLVEKHRRGGVMTVTTAQNNVHPGLPLGHYLARGV